MVRYPRVRMRIGRQHRLLWRCAGALLALLAVGDIMALAHLETIEAAAPALARQPLTDAVLISVPLLPALALHAAEQGLRRVPETDVRRPAVGGPWRRGVGMTPPRNDSTCI